MSKIANKQVNYNSNIVFAGAGYKVSNVVAGVADNDAVNVAQLNGAVEGRSWKHHARVASVSNVVNLSSVLVADFDGTGQGIILIEGDRILLKNQAIDSQNGIYIVGVVTIDSASLTRSTDADTAVKLESASLFIDEGTNANTAWTQTTDNFILETDPVVFVKTSDTDTIAVGTIVDKELIPAVTSGNEFNTGLAISYAPSGYGYVSVSVNGQLQILGNGVKTKDCYFSSDSNGATAKAISAIAAGDKLFWNGVFAEFQLAITDRIDFCYDV